MEKRRLLEFRKPRTGELLSFKTRQYFVTDDGRVWYDDLKRFASMYDNSGYLAVNLRDDAGKQHSNIGVHALVASVFQRLLERGEQVHHHNHDKKDNRLDNLTIIDGGEHSRMHWKDGTMDRVGEMMKKAWRDGRFDAGREKLKNVGNFYRPAKQIAQLSLDGHLVRVWPSVSEADRNGWNKGAVPACCRNCYSSQGNNIYKGFKWMWLEEYQKEKEEANLGQLASS